MYCQSQFTWSWRYRVPHHFKGAFYKARSNHLQGVVLGNNWLKPCRCIKRSWRQFCLFVPTSWWFRFPWWAINSNKHILLTLETTKTIWQHPTPGGSMWLGHWRRTRATTWNSCSRELRHGRRRIPPGQGWLHQRSDELLAQDTCLYGHRRQTSTWGPTRSATHNCWPLYTRSGPHSTWARAR